MNNDSEVELSDFNYSSSKSEASILNHYNLNQDPKNQMVYIV